MADEKKMSVAVGRRVYSYVGGRSSFVDPQLDGYTPILSLTKSTAYGDLSPYLLCDDRGFLLENIWQVFFVFFSFYLFSM